MFLKNESFHTLFQGSAFLITLLGNSKGRGIFFSFAPSSIWPCCGTVLDWNNNTEELQKALFFVKWKSHVTRDRGVVWTMSPNVPKGEERGLKWANNVSHIIWMAPNLKTSSFLKGFLACCVPHIDQDQVSVPANLNFSFVEIKSENEMIGKCQTRQQCTQLHWITDN